MIELDALRVPVLVAGLVTTVVGTWAAIADVPRGGQRVLGGILVLKGLNLTAAGLMSSQATDMVGPLLIVQHYLLLAIVPLAVYFLYVFTRPMQNQAWHGSKYVLVATLLLLEGAYLVDHGLVHTIAQGTGTDGLQTAGPGWVYTSYGPLAVLLALAAPTYPLLGMVLVRRALTGPPEERMVLWLLSIGLIVNGIFDGGLATAYLIHDPAIGNLSGFGWMLGLIHAASLLPAGIGLGILVGGELSKPQPERWKVAVPAVLAIAAWFSGPMPVLLGAPDYGQTWPTALAIGLWRTVAAFMVGTALWTLRRNAPASTRTPAIRGFASAEEA